MERQPGQTCGELLALLLFLNDKTLLDIQTILFVTAINAICENASRGAIFFVFVSDFNFSLLDEVVFW